MDTKRVLDRVDEVTAISEWLSSLPNDNTCLIVSARTGVGKSTLTNHLAKQVDDRFFLRVAVSRNVAKTLQSGSYLKALARSIIGLAEIIPEIRNFEEVEIGKSRREAVKQVSLLAVDFVVPEKIRTVLIDAYHKWRGKGQDSWESKFNEVQSASLGEIRNYVRDVLRVAPISLIFENAQNIDEYSLNAILGILTTSIPHAVFLEFTIDDESDYGAIHEMKNRFEQIDCTTALLPLANLPLKELIKLIPKDSLPGNSILSQGYASWNGNLAPLIDLDCLIVKKHAVIPKQFDFQNVSGLTASNIAELSDAAASVLVHLSILGGEADFGHLSRCIAHGNDSISEIDITKNLVELEQCALIKSASTSKIITRHDSVTDSVLSDDNFAVLTSITAKKIRNFCSTRLSETSIAMDQKSVLLKSMLNSQFYLGDIKGIIDSLNSLYSTSGNENSPRVLCDNLLMLSELCENNGYSIPEHVSEDLRCKLLSLCIRNRQFSPAMKIMRNQDRALSTREYIGHALVYLGLDNPNKSREIVNELLNSEISIENEAILVEIVNYVVDRHTGNIVCGTKKWLICIGKEHWINSLSYGYALRNAEMFLPPRKSIPFLVKSIRHFAKFENAEQVAFSLNSLAAQLIRIGKNHRANKMLTQSVTLLNGSLVEKFSVFNNLAIAKIHVDGPNDKIRSLFEQAATSVSANFERLSITNNLAIYYFTDGKTDLSLSACKALAQMLVRKSVSSPQINKTAMKNLNILANRISNKDLCKLLVDIPDIGVSDTEVYQNERFDDLASKPSYILLSHWYPDVTHLLEHEPKALQ